MRVEGFSGEAWRLSWLGAGHKWGALQGLLCSEKQMNEKSMADIAQHGANEREKHRKNWLQLGDATSLASSDECCRLSSACACLKASDANCNVHLLCCRMAQALHSVLLPALRVGCDCWAAAALQPSLHASVPQAALREESWFHT
eukprot:scaffold87345_cov15-Tisochrysis_lutea.AAC.2